MTAPLTIPATLASLPRAFAWTEDAASAAALPDWTRYALLICVEEAVSNVIRYGYPADDAPADDRTIRLTLGWDDAAATLTIEDHGIAFDPNTLAAPILPTSVEDARIGGLGVHLMRRYAETMHYQRLGDTNRLSLRIKRTTVGER